MSDDGVETAREPEPAPSPAPDPDPAPDRPPHRPRWQRILVLALGAGAAIALAVGIAMRDRPVREHDVEPSERRGAIRAPERPALPPGQGGVRLTGIVVDGAGAAVVGAELSAEPEVDVAPPRVAAATEDARVADAGIVATADGGVSAIAVAPATGADGRFALDGLAPGRYRLRVTGPGILAAELRMVVVPANELRIVVARRVTIEGTVTDGGKPVSAAVVGVRGDAIGGTLEVKTGTDGTFAVRDVPEGSYQVYAYQGALAARTLRVIRIGAGPFAPVELRLEPAAIVVGRVLDRGEGTGLVAAVELRSVGDDQAPRYARSGDDGVFRIEGVPNGRWIADAFSPGYLSPGGVELEAGLGIPELRLSPGATIEGRVIDGDGRPIEGASVRAVVAGGDGTEYSAFVEQDQLRRFSGRTVATMRSGAAPFADDPQLLPRGELGVLLGSIPPIPPPGTVPARPASIVDPAVVAGSLVGEPTPLSVDPARASIWTTGRDGRYRIRGLFKAKLTALASAPGFAEARSRDVRLGAGQLVSDVDIVLTPGTYLVGKVADPRGAPLAGARVTVHPERGASLEAFSDGAGMYRIGPVTGKLALVASAYGHVEARRSLDIAPTAGRTPVELREDITLEAADAILAGTLDDTTGAAVGGAHVEVIGGAGAGRSVVVADDGTFSLDMLPHGRLRVRVTHPAYPPAELDAVASSTGERVRLRLPLGGQVEGALIDDASGSPLAGMTIDARGPAGATASAATDTQGLWTLGPLRPGSWQVQVKLPGYLPYTRTVDVPASHAPGVTSVRDVRIELARGALVGGTVRDRRGQRVAGASIVVRRADGSGTPVEASTDAQGEFRIHDCPTGELIVSASTDEDAGSTSVTVRPGDEVLGLAIEIR